MIGSFIENKSRGIFLFIILATLIDRVLLLSTFGWHWTSNDDIIFWLGARDYANGGFHEPFMYGQDYNYMVESLLAVPFVWMGIPYAKLMPVITSFMALLPFWTFAHDEFRKKNFHAAFFIAAIPLLLPIPYGIMTTVTRGFINGIFFLSFFPFTRRASNKWIRFAGMSAICTLAAIVNANSLIVAIPLMIMEWVKEFRNWKFYVATLIGAVPFLLFYYFSRQYYVHHPEVVLHSLHGGWRMDFHAKELIPEALGNLDDMFRYLGLFWWKNGTILPVLLVTATIIQFATKTYRTGLAILTGILIIIIAFGFPKVHDGFETPFYSNARNFLAVPLLLGIALSHVKLSVNIAKYAGIVLLFIVPVFFFARIFMMSDECKYYTTTKYPPETPLTIITIDSLQQLTNQYMNIAQENKVELICCMNGPSMDIAKAQFICVGGELLHDNFPANYIPQYERRSWVRKEVQGNVYRTILIAGCYPNVVQQMKDHGFQVREIAADPLLFIIEENTKSFSDIENELLRK